GLLIAEDLRTCQPVAEGLVLVELPDDLFIARDFENLRTLFTGMAIADDEIAVVEFRQEGCPLESDLGIRDMVLDLPNSLASAGDFAAPPAAARSDQRVAALQPNPAEDARLDRVLPDHFTLGIVLGNHAGAFGTNQVIAI